MPLDTLPPNPTRRLLMLLVLCVFFIGSLGAADGVIKHRQAEQLQTVDMPDSSNIGGLVPFKPDETLADEYPVVAMGGTVGRGTRVLYVFDKPGVDPANFKTEMEQVFGHVTGDVMYPLPESGDTMLLGRPALQLNGISIDHRKFAIQRSGMFNTNLVTVFYSGTMPETDTDAQLFESLCRSLIQRPGRHR